MVFMEDIHRGCWRRCILSLMDLKRGSRLKVSCYSRCKSMHRVKNKQNASEKDWPERSSLVIISNILMDNSHKKKRMNLPSLPTRFSTPTTGPLCIMMTSRIDSSFLPRLLKFAAIGSLKMLLIVMHAV
jgi:hypothetical protein